MNTLLIKNGTIIDVEHGITYKGAIEVEGDKIKRIIKEGEELPKELKTIDIKGKYIIPGLIDVHCHINEGFAPHFVASGVTTVRNTAGNVDLLKSLIEKPIDAPTPSVYASDRMIDGAPGQWGPTSFGNFVTDEPEEARNEVRRQVTAGAKFIKVYGWAKQEVIQAAAEEAKKFDLEVSIDLINSKVVTALDAAKAGVTWFEHASGFAQELFKGWSPLVDQAEWQHINWEYPEQEKITALCEKMLEHQVKLCPTMVLFDQAMSYPNYWSPKNKVIDAIKNKKHHTEYWDSHAEMIEAIKENNAVINNLTKSIAKTYYDLGGTVVAGTDTPALMYTYPGMALHRELEIFVEIGFTEVEALQAATINAAKSISLDDRGLIQEGKVADLVILNKNPLENIKHTLEINLIVKGGKVYHQDEILSAVPSEEDVQKRMEAFMKQWEAQEVN